MKYHNWLATLALPMMLICCVGEDADYSQSRGGKADDPVDLSGSCENEDGNHCGERSTDGCFCDEQCAFEGDCCHDMEPLCAPEDPEPTKFTKLAQCDGSTSDGSKSVQAVIFFNGTEGMIFLAVEDDDSVRHEMSATEINSTDDPDGFPHVINNDFDLDVFISDEDASFVDISLDGSTLADVECNFHPHNG